MQAVADAAHPNTIARISAQISAAGGEFLLLQFPPSAAAAAAAAAAVVGNVVTLAANSANVDTVAVCFHFCTVPQDIANFA